MSFLRFVGGFLVFPVGGVWFNLLRPSDYNNTRDIVVHTSVPVKNVRFRVT
jgi:hypothetical protein